MAQRQPIAMLVQGGGGFRGTRWPQSKGVAGRDADPGAEGAPLMEIKMLLHLPIAIIATLSVIAISVTVPKFDTVKECAFRKRFVQSRRSVRS